MSLQKPTTIQLLIGTMVSLVKNNIGGKIGQPIYAPIHKYHFLSPVIKQAGLSNFSTGIYTSPDKGKVFIKTWTGKIKDINYYLLVNEYLANSLLFKKLQNGKHKGQFTIPKIYRYHETANSLSIIYEYIPGKPLTKVNTSVQAKVLSSIVAGLYDISQNLNKQEKYLFPKRSYIVYLATFPIISIFVYACNSNSRKFVRQSLGTYVNAFTHFRDHTLMLAHRDLNPNNILIYKKNAYLIDCERLVLTLPYFDITHMLITKANSDIKKNLQVMFNKYSKYRNHFLEYYICLHYILSVNHTKQTKQFYIDELTKL